MKDYFKKLFNYNHWANELILKSLIDYNLHEGEPIKIYSHVINAQYIWYSRITGQKELHKPVWSVHTLDNIQKFLPENFTFWMGYLENITEEEMGREISYSNSEGHAFHNVVQDMLPHIVNHASYHRGQVNKLIRQAGYNPVNTDYITWRRVLNK